MLRNGTLVGLLLFSLFLFLPKGGDKLLLESGVFLKKKINSGIVAETLCVSWFNCS